MVDIVKKECFTFIWEMCFRFDPDWTYLWHFLISAVLVLIFAWPFEKLSKGKGINLATIFSIGIYTGIEFGRDMVVDFFDPGDWALAIISAVIMRFILRKWYE